MSVYNEEEYIADAVNSILRQTVQSLELLVYNDCSSDGTLQILRRIEDPRLRIIENKENCGLTKNLNKGLELARGRYIARMDGDDISKPERFARQIHYLETHPEVMLISCQTETFGMRSLRSRFPESSEYIRCCMLVRPVLAHPGYMMRRELTSQFHYRYDESFRSAQDYDFAARVGARFPLGIASPVLLQYRSHKGQVSESAGGRQLANADRVRSMLLAQLGVTLSERETAAYRAFVLEKRDADAQTMRQAYEAVRRILEANRRHRLYEQTVLTRCMESLFLLWLVRTKNRKLWTQINQICPTMEHGARKLCGALLGVILKRPVVREIRKK